MSFGSVQTQSRERKLVKFSGNDRSTNQQAVAVPYGAGVFKIGLIWVTPQYNLTVKRITNESGGKASSKGGQPAAQKKYRWDMCGIACYCPDDAPVDSLEFVLINDEIAFKGPLTRTAGQHYAAFSLQKYCPDCRIWWGTKDSPLDDHILATRGTPGGGVDFRDKTTWPIDSSTGGTVLGNLVAGVTDPKSGHYDTHSAMRNVCRFTFKQFHGGSSKNMPNVEVVLRRGCKFFSGRLEATADGVNPMGPAYEINTDDLAGAGLPVARLDEPSWQDTATKNNDAGIKLAPLVTQSASLRGFFADYLPYYNGWFRTKGNLLEAGIYLTGNLNTAGLLTLGDDDLVEEPEIEVGTLDDTFNYFAIVITSKDHGYNNDEIPARYVDDTNFRKVGERRPKWIQAPYIISEAIAIRYLTARGIIEALEPHSGGAAFKRERVLALPPGSLFKLNVASYSQTLLLRVKSRQRPGSRGGATRLNIEREPGVWPALYDQTANTHPPDFLYSVQAIAHYRIVELPRGLRDNPDIIEIAVLALRPNTITIGFNVHLSIDGGVTYEQIAHENHFAVYGKLRFDPSQIAGLKLWLKADALLLNDGDPVASWTDSSGNANHAAQATSANRPTFKANILNGKPVIRFDGVNDFLTAPNGALSAISNAASVFIVAKTTDASRTGAVLQAIPDVGTNRFDVFLPYSDGRVYWELGDATGAGVLSAVWGGSTTSFFIWSFTAGGSAMGAWRTGSSLATTAASSTFTPGAKTLQISANAAGAGTYWVGDIAEILIFNSSLSAADRQKVEAYLGDKYGIAVGGSLTAYPASTADPDTTLGVLADVFGYDLEQVTSQSDQARDDDSLLLWLDNEITSVGELSVVAPGRDNIFVRRGRYNTIPTDHALNADLWFMLRADIFRINNANFNSGASVKFKLQPFSELEDYPVASAAAIDYTFSTPPTYAAPSLSPASGSFSGTMTVYLQSDPALTTYFTLDGADATGQSAIWGIDAFGAGVIAFDFSCIIKVVSIAPNGVRTAQVVGVYTLVASGSAGAQTCAAVRFGFSGNKGQTAGNLTMRCATAGASISYSLNGGATTTYTVPIAIALNDVVEAWATATGMAASARTIFDNTYTPNQGGGGGDSGGEHNLP